MTVAFRGRHGDVEDRTGEIRMNCTRGRNVNRTKLLTVRCVIVWPIERNYNAVLEHVELVFAKNNESDWLKYNAVTDDVWSALALIG